MENINDIPSAVMEVFALMYRNAPVSLATLTRCKNVVNNHPAHFPWEHKYKMIPKSVHDAYNKEVAPPLSITEVGHGIGLIPTIMKGGTVIEFDDLYKENLTLTQLLEQAIERDEQRKKIEKERVKKEIMIWDKHYKKYDLEYSNTIRFV